MKKFVSITIVFTFVVWFFYCNESIAQNNLPADTAEVQKIEKKVPLHSKQNISTKKFNARQYDEDKVFQKRAITARLPKRSGVQAKSASGGKDNTPAGEKRLITVTGNPFPAKLKMQKGNSVKNAPDVLPPDFPRYVNTGNPDLDEKDYEIRKAQWIENNKELYEEILNKKY